MRNRDAGERLLTPRRRRGRPDEGACAPANRETSVPGIIDLPGGWGPAVPAPGCLPRDLEPAKLWASGPGLWKWEQADSSVPCAGYYAGLCRAGSPRPDTPPTGKAASVANLVPRMGKAGASPDADPARRLGER